MRNSCSPKGMALALVCFVWGAGGASAQEPCGEWTPRLFAASGVDVPVRAIATFDDGSGEALYAAGCFTRAGGVEAANGIARWDGHSWSPVGSGMGWRFCSVRAMAVFDDGTGPALYVGGDFTSAGGVEANAIARWDGRSWSPLGSGLNGLVRTLCVFDDGRGPALYAGGDFTTAGGGSANRITRWDGASWSPLGDGLGNFPRAMAVYDGALIVGGNFESAGGLPIRYLARWDGARWTALGSGVNNDVLALTVHDDGTGTWLVAGGGFTSAGGTNIRGVARWNGSNWHPLGDGLIFSVSALTSYDDGTGPVLYAGGNISRSGSVSIQRVGRFNGTSWEQVGAGFDGPPIAFQAFDDGRGRALYACGTFNNSGPASPYSLAVWDGSSWKALGQGVTGEVEFLASADDGTGPTLFVGGRISIGGIPRRLVRWNGSEWIPPDEDLAFPATPRAMVSFDDGSGPALYVGGAFTRAGSVVVNNVARWNGREWSALGTGTDGEVFSLAVHDDGSGPALVAGGRFDSAGGVAASNVAKWDGTSWSPLAAGLGSGGGTQVRALASYDFGHGPQLFAAGDFRRSGNSQVVHSIGRWDGIEWWDIGFRSVTRLTTLTVFDDGSGPGLYVTGSFDVAGSVPADHIARWDVGGWSALGEGLNGGPRSVIVADDGKGPALFVVGDFWMAGGIRCDRVARWDGRRWSALGAGFPGDTLTTQVNAIAAFDFGGHTGIFAGGRFQTTSDLDSPNLAEWTDLCAQSLRGRVNAGCGPIADVVFVNGSSGGADRRVTLAPADAFTLFVGLPPAEASRAPFALYARSGEPRRTGLSRLPLNLGTSAFPTPLSGGAPKAVWNNTGKRPLGSPNLGSAPAPSVVIGRPGGLGRSVVFTVQGIVFDPGSAALRPASVTNAVIVDSR